MAQNEGVYVFPDAMAKASGIDPGLLALLKRATLIAALQETTKL